MKVKFLYTKESHFKKAITKTGAPKHGKTHFIVTIGENYSDCLLKAKNECKFHEHQLLGSLIIN